MIELDRDVYDNLVGMIEDAVSQAVEQDALRGLSGQAAWKIVSAHAVAKEMEFAGFFTGRDIEEVMDEISGPSMSVLECMADAYDNLPPEHRIDDDED